MGTAAKHFFLYLLLISGLYAATPQYVVLQTPIITPTQAILRWTAFNSDGVPNNTPCTVQASEGSTYTAPGVNDINTSLFASSNTDARDGSSIHDGYHYFTLGTRGKAFLDLNNHLSSRTLQVFTLHNYGVTCGTHTIVTGTFTTANLPMGNSYPEAPGWDANGFGNIGVPWIDMSDMSKSYLDPLTGVKFTRMTSALDITGGNQTSNQFQITPLSLTTGWSNLANADAPTSMSTAAYASSSTVGASMFIPTALQISPYIHSGYSTIGSYDPSDMQIKANCRGVGSPTLGVCLSFDSGQTCASTTQVLTCSTSFTVQRAPTTYPKPMYTSWGTLTSDFNLAALRAFYTSTVNVSGTTVSWVSGDTFSAIRKPGSKLLITGTSPACTNNQCTVVSNDSEVRFTIAESLGTPVTGATLTDLGPGVKITHLSGTSVDANFNFDMYTGSSVVHGSNAEADVCSTLPITDITTDASGVSTGRTDTGYLCALGVALYGGGGDEIILFIPSTGEHRRMSSLKDGSGNRYAHFASPWSTTNNKTILATKAGHLWKGVLGAGPYLDVDGISGVDNFTWTDLGNSINSQITTYGGPIATAYATGLFGTMTLSDLAFGEVYWTTATSGADGPCIMARTTADTNTLIDVWTSYMTYPFRWGSCHGGFSVGPYRATSSNTLYVEDSSGTGKPLGGSHQIRILSMKRGGGTFVTSSITITGATLANPGIFTSVNHGLDQGALNISDTYSTMHVQATCAGGTGSFAALNGLQTIQKTDNDHFEFIGAGNTPVDTTTFTGSATGMTCSAAPALIHGLINGLTNASPAVVTVTPAISTCVPTTCATYESIDRNMRFIDGDPVVFTADATKHQYYVKVSCASCNAYTFEIYNDHALTSPASNTTNQIISNVGSRGSLAFAETCPVSNHPWDLTNNSDTGAIGARCFTVKLDGDPCSYWATASEHATYPCAAYPSITNASSLQPIAAGDAIRDKGRNAYEETMMAVAVTHNSLHDVDVTFMRWTPNKYQGGDDSLESTESSTHKFGWTPVMAPTWSHACTVQLINSNDSTHALQPMDPNFCVVHGDFTYDPLLNSVTWASGDTIGAGGTADSLANVPVANLPTVQLTYNNRGVPKFANSPAQTTSSSYQQSYATHRQLLAPLNEQVWKADTNVLNPPFGGVTGAGSTIYTAPTAPLKIRGTTYDVSNTTNNVYKITTAATPFDLKHIPMYSWAGRFILLDKSGPSSLLTDTDAWKFCIAYIAGECRPNSSANDIFVSTPVYHNILKDGTVNSAVCYTNTFDIIVPCIVPLPSNAGWYLQDEILPIDRTATKVRKLTTGLQATGTHQTFTTWYQMTGGKWGFIALFAQGLHEDFYAFKLPPWPSTSTGADSINRQNYIPIKVRITDHSPSARILFGYAENTASWSAPINSFWCTSRKESCSTEIPTATPTDPFSYTTIETSVTHVPCLNSCILTIPAVPGRIVYYVVQLLDAAGTVTSTSPMKMAYGG